MAISALKNAMLLIISACVVSFLVEPLQALASYYDAHDQGWFWYQDPQKIQQPKQLMSDLKANEQDPDKLMQQLHRMENTALRRAYFYPTEKNIKSYMELQDKVEDRAMLLSALWKEALLKNPTLDYSIKHPTSNVGREIYLSQRQQKEEAAIEGFAHTYGLFFFYRGDCPYCHRFAPILKAFVAHYGIQVIPVSMGAGYLPEFPNARRDNGQAVLLHVSVYPSLFAVNPKTQKIIPVAYGLMSFEALKERIYNIITHFQGET